MPPKLITPADMQQVARIAAACRYDPLLWAESAWDWGHGDLVGKDIREWQAELFDDIAQHLQNPETRYDPLKLSRASGHGIGKSACMGMLSNWAMSCYVGARVVITANTENQLRTKTSPEIGTWFNSSISAPLFNVDTMSIKPREKPDKPWSLDFTPWSEHNTEAFAGLHAEGRIILLAMDEASAIADKIWEVAEGALTDENTVIIWIVLGNPTRNVGRFRETFRKNRNEWNHDQIDSRTVEGTNKKYLNEMVQRYGENSDTAKVRVRGMFPSASSRQLIPTHKVDEAQGRHLNDDQYKFAPVILTCDPAWTGEDELVIAKRQGLHFEVLEVMEKNDNDVHVANKLARYEDEHEADAVFIDFGYGTGIKSVGETMDRDWELVNFAGESPDKGFANMRAYMWGKVSDWLDDGGAIDPDDDVLYTDLISVETKPTLSGVIQLRSKEEMKKEGLPSPNRGDGLAISFYRPVTKKPSLYERDYRRKANNAKSYRNDKGEYDPHA